MTLSMTSIGPMTRSRAKLLHNQRQSSSRSLHSQGSDSSVPHLEVETVDEKNEEDIHLLRGCVRDTYNALKPLSDDGTMEEEYVKDLVGKGSIALFESRKKDQRHYEILECMRQGHNHDGETGVLFQIKNAFLQARSDITFTWAIAVWVKMGACVVYGLYGEGTAKPVTTILYQVLDGFWYHFVGTCPLHLAGDLAEDSEIEAQVDEVYNVTSEAVVQVESSWYSSWMFLFSQNSVQETVKETVVEPLVETIVEPINRTVQCGGYIMAHVVSGIILLGCVFFALRYFFGSDMASQFAIFFTVGVWVSAMDISWTVPYVVIGMALGIFWMGYLQMVFELVEKEVIAILFTQQAAVDQESLYMYQHEATKVVRAAQWNFGIWCVVHVVTLIIYANKHVTET